MKRINWEMVMAVSAVLISAASFYATYLQAEAAELQVRAATWPYLQIEHGNYDEDERVQRISYKIQNAGVGPANVKSFSLAHGDFTTANIAALLEHCCLDGHKDGSWRRDPAAQAAMQTLIVDRLAPQIIPADSDALVFELSLTDDSRALWQKVDKARWSFKAKACYCSLLDACYRTDFVADPVRVKACPDMQPATTAKP